MDPQLTQDILAFPWEALPQVSRRGIAAHREAHASFPGFADVHEVAASLSSLLGVPCEIKPLAIAQGFLAPLPQGVAVELVLEGAPGSSSSSSAPARAGEGVLVECDLALALALISRTTQSAVPTLIATESLDAPSPRICGAVAAIAMYLVRRGPGKILPLVLRGNAPADDALMRFLSEGPHAGAEPIYASYTVIVGEEAYLARVWLRTSGVLQPTVRRSLADFGRAPLALKVVLAEELLASAELAALSPGDVWVLSRLPADDAVALQGPITLAAPGSNLGLRATLIASKLHYDGEIVDLSGEPRLQDATMAIDRVFEEVPVAVRVEVGAVELPAGEWARLRTGDTLTLQKRLGDPVVLRVAGVEVARGELVNVEGELGVRILEKHAARSERDSVDTQVVPT